MLKVNINNWKPFQLSSLFEIVKGTRLTKQDMKEGNIDYIGATAFNNGITNKIGNNEHLHPAGTLTVAYNGSIGQTFYHDEPYWATDDVNVFYPKFSMTKHIALFIAPLIKSIGRNYEYTDKWQIEDMKKSIIYLPIEDNGEPNWEYMEAYMSKIENKVNNSINQLLMIMGGDKLNLTSIISWKEYDITDYFEIINTGNVLKRDIKFDSGNTPYVTASGLNNGVVTYINSSNLSLMKGHCLLIGGKTFTLTYQNKDFVSNDSHNLTVTLKPQYPSSENIYLFLLTALKCNLFQKYSWGDAVTKEKLLNEKIKLPCNSSNQLPDWHFMDIYIQELKEKNKQHFEL